MGPRGTCLKPARSLLDARTLEIQRSSKARLYAVDVEYIYMTFTLCSKPARCVTCFSQIRQHIDFGTPGPFFTGGPRKSYFPSRFLLKA